MIVLHAREIGGARVRRRFSMAGQVLQPGSTLSREQVLGIAEVNRRALIEQQVIEVWPLADERKLRDERRHSKGISA